MKCVATSSVILSKIDDYEMQKNKNLYLLGKNDSIVLFRLVLKAWREAPIRPNPKRGPEGPTPPHNPPLTYKGNIKNS